MNHPSTPGHLVDLQMTENKIESSVEVTDILERIHFGAMSFGALTESAHRTLDTAATLVGINCNGGEGGIIPGE